MTGSAFMSDYDQFRSEVAQWLEEHCSASMRTPMPQNETVWGGRKELFPHPESRSWMQLFADRGWLAPTWPEIYGGGGLDQQQAKILQQEMRKLACRPPMMSLGVHMMGPTIMEYGTEEQKMRFLPPIARGEIRWCQGYSEPGAGSDLASLKTRAEKVGDHFIVTGQKVWTSYADKSDYLFCLVRTDFNASKHTGISVLLIDMESAGVSVRPIELISGSSHFCEVFLDEVKVPQENMLGEINKGWDIAKRMLQHERNMMGEIDQAGGGFNPDFPVLAKTYLGQDDKGRIADGVLRDELVKVEMERKAIHLTSARMMQEIKADGYSMAAPMMKLAMSENEKAKMELMLKVVGSQGLSWGDQSYSEQEQRIAKEWAFSKIQSIGGGTTEVQLNIIAKRVLGLPE
jgi:acyl-CoA dehydrogenase